MIQQFHFWVNTQKNWKKEQRLYTRVYNSSIHKTQKADATQVSMDEWMDKQSVIHIQWNMIQFLKRKEILKKNKGGNLKYAMKYATTWMKLEDFFLC